MQPTLPTSPRRRLPRLHRPVVAFAMASVLGIVGVSDAMINRSTATSFTVETESDALVRNVDGSYRWGALRLTGTDWTGAPGELKRTTRWPDDVIGVVGGRWDDQIDFGAAPGEGAEQVDIEFPAPASNVVLTVGMMGANEGGRGKDEAGIWRGYDATGALVAEGVLDPDVSDLGPRVKARGYGEYPITLASATPIMRVELIAVDWDAAGSPPRTANNTDFGIVRVEWTDEAGGPAPTPPPATTAPPVTTAPPSTITPPEPPAPGQRRTVRGTDLLDAEGVRLVGRGLDGLPAGLGQRRGGLGVAGGRYDFQIDYDATLDASEMLIVEFSSPASKIEIDLAMLGSREWRGLPETGTWRARSSSGEIVADGVIDPVTSGSTIMIGASDVIAVDIEATAYGNGAGTDRTDNNSDFAVEAVTWSTSTAPTPTTIPPSTTVAPTTAPPTTVPSTTVAPTTTAPTPTTTPGGSVERIAASGTDLLDADGLDLVFRSADGTVTTHGSRGGALGVNGGRYDFQLDVELDGQRSESIELRFDPPATDVAVTLTMLELAEWRNLPETGVWTARDASGEIVGSGVLDPVAAGSTSSTTEFALATTAPAASVTIEATAYGNGAAVDRADNNSDFALAAVAWSRNTTAADPAPPPPTTAPATTAPATTAPAAVEPPDPAPSGEAALALRSGAWSDPEMWSDGVPGAGDEVMIPRGIEVTLDTTTASLGPVHVVGTLVVADRPLELTADSLVVIGALRAGSEAAPLTSEVTIRLTGLEAHAGHGAHEDHGARSLAVMGGGVLDLHGVDRAKRSWTVLDGSVTAGASSIAVADPTGWEVGDRIVIAPSGLEALEDDVVTITAIDGTAISFAPALGYDHHGAIEVHDGRELDMRAEVGLLSRNLVVTSADDAEARRLGGHIMVMLGATARVDGVELRDLGQSGNAGRYPFHWHVAGDVRGQYIRNASINRSFQRGVVIHETSNAIVENVVAHDVFSHAFTFSENGPEWNNQLVNNLAVRVSHVPRDSGLFSFPHSRNPRKSTQAEERASGFWGRNPQNTLIGNRVAGVERGQGFFFDSRSMSHRNKQTIKPATSPVVFRDNVAHSISGIANRLYNYGPVAVGHAVFVSTYAHDPAIDIDGFTAYKAVTGAWLENGNTTLVRAIVSDSSAGVLTMHGAVRESVIVGSSSNRIGGEPRMLSDQRLGGGIHLTNQGKDKIVRLTDVTFIGVDTAAIVVRRVELAPGSRVEGITLIDTDPIHVHRPESVGRIVDADGSLCGAAGATIAVESSGCATRS